MNPKMFRYDPWGPISTTLYTNNNSDLVENLIGFTGISLYLSSSQTSHVKRIREYKPIIQTAYDDLPDEEKGRFAQIVAKELLANNTVLDEIKDSLVDRLNNIGWTITEEGTLTTQDSLLSEQFFPLGTTYDAYIAIRDILEKAASSAMIVDAYLGSTIFATLSAINPTTLSVQLLTTEGKLKPDFRVEAANFRQQYTAAQLEVRTTTDFHDRFITIDDTEYYHVGASIKDAGKRAFLISRLQDEPIVSILKQYLSQVWQSATLVS
jgi:hypothetical protein